jgi:hypothetical protein
MFCHMPVRSKNQVRPGFLIGQSIFFIPGGKDQVPVVPEISQMMEDRKVEPAVRYHADKPT